MTAKAKLQMLRIVHQGASVLLRAEGYRFEIRRHGELKIGLWRKRFGRKGPEGRSDSKKKPARVILIPGFGDTPLSWLGVLTLLTPVLRRKCDEIIIADFPGYTGFLSKERVIDSADLLMSTFFDVLDSLEPRIIIGHSMGGWLAAQYAAYCGLKMRPSAGSKTYSGPAKIILANPSGISGRPDERAAADEKLQGLVDEGFSNWRKHVFRKEPFWFKWVEPEFSRFAAQKEVAKFFSSLRDEHYLNERLDRIQAETWLIWGEHDTLVPHEMAQEWLKRLRAGAGLVLMPGAGHTPQVETPAVFSAILGQILLGRDPHPLGSRWWRLTRKRDGAEIQSSA